MVFDKSDHERKQQRLLMGERRAAANDVILPRIARPKRRALCLSSPPRFLQTYLPNFFHNPFTRGQLEIIEAVEDAAMYGTQTAIAWPRGDGKSKICEGMTIFCTLKGYIDFTVPIAATESFAGNILRNIKTMLKSPVFIEDFPEIGYLFKIIKDKQARANNQTLNGRPTEINWTSEYIQFPAIDDSPASKAIIYPLPITGAIRGLCIGERRPNMIIIDDPETAESSRNEGQVGVRMNICNKDVSGLKGPTNKLGIIALVTIQTNISMAAKITNRKLYPAWNGIRKGLIENWPTKEAMELWDAYMELRRTCQEGGDKIARAATIFYLENQEAMHAGCVINNPYRFNSVLDRDGNQIEYSALQACMNFICDRDIDAFNCEYQNDPSGDEEGAEQTEELSAKVVESRINKLDQGVLPIDSEGVSIAIDVGKRLCHWVKTAWSFGNRGSIIDYGVIEVHGIGYDTPKKAIEEALQAALFDFYESLSYGESVPDWGLIDASDGVLKDAVYSFVRGIGDFPPIAASKGVGDGKADKDSQPGDGTNDIIFGDYWYAKMQFKDGIYLYHPDASYWKRWVHERFSIHPFDSEGQQIENTLTIFCPHKPRQHSTFAKHIVAKLWRETFVPGRGMTKGFVPISKNDHWLDALYMSCAAAAMRGFVQPTELHLSAFPQQSETTRQSQFGVSRSFSINRRR